MRPRPVLRIARWELARSAGELDRRVAVVLVLVVLALVALTPALATSGGAPDGGIYRVALPSDSPYRAPVDDESSLRAVPDRRGVVAAREADVAVRRGGVVVADSEKGRAALAALRRAVAASNDRRMDEEPDRAAAFPVAVEVRYVDRQSALAAVRVESGGGGESGDGGDGGTPGPGEGATGDGGDSGGTGAGGGDGTPSSGDAGGVGAALQSTGPAILGGGQRGTPGDIRPPFPFRSLVLAFAFVLPLNVVAQAYGSSVMTERLNRRGEPLLVSPVRPREIIAGKTLPYALAAVAATVVVAALVGGGPLAVVAVLPVAALFLASTFVAALFARSFKELTFVTVTASVFITTYTFVPAIFTDVHPIAAISPLSVVVRDLTGAGVGPGTALFATVPMTVAATVLYGLGAGVFREEDLFTQRAPPAKVLDALAAHLTLRRVPLWTALSVPFVFVCELFAVAVLFVAPPAAALPALFAVVAVVEEAAKSVHLFAGYERGRLPRTDRTALLAGALSGLGFAVAEKAALVTQLVGLPDLELGRAAFAPAAASDPATLVALLLAPFALHVGTATVSSLGARRSSGAYLLALCVAVAVHLLYDLAVVSALV